MIGLKRGTVELYDHEGEWEQKAAQTIEKLKSIFKSTADDIQHIGSTAIVHIKAKPIIDIAVAVRSFDKVLPLIPILEENGFIHRPHCDNEGQMLFVCGDFEKDTRTHHIHIVRVNSVEWNNYINFRDYLNVHINAAKKYENLKIELQEKYPSDRMAYTDGKEKFISRTLQKALCYSYLGKTVNVKIDRPLGSVHPKHSDIVYTVNYGYLPEVIGGDGEELDVYVLGVDKPVDEFSGRVIGVIYRDDDNEDKLVVAPFDTSFTLEEVEKAVYFQEQYFKIRIELLVG